MVIIGLLLLIIAVAFGIDLVWKNNVHIANPTVFGEKLGLHSAASLFVVGAITGAAVLLGIALLLWGVRRKGASAVSRRHERTETRRLREDRDREDRDKEPESTKEPAHASPGQQPADLPSQNDDDDDAKSAPVG
jgi:hypothetical protein